MALPFFFEVFMSKFIIVENYSTHVFDTLEDAKKEAEESFQAGEDISLYEVVSNYKPSAVVFSKVDM